jgi:hypothetical protein
MGYLLTPYKERPGPVRPAVDTPASPSPVAAAETASHKRSTNGLKEARSIGVAAVFPTRPPARPQRYQVSFLVEPEISQSTVGDAVARDPRSEHARSADP